PAPGPVLGPPAEGERGSGGSGGWLAHRGVPLADAITYGPLAGTASSTCPADAPVSSTWTITVAPVAAIASPRRSPSAVASPERRRICGAAAAGTACATSSAASNAPRAHALRPPPRRGVDRVDHAPVLDRIRRPGRD